MPTKSFDDFLKKQLRDKELAIMYLNEALENGTTEEFLLSLRQVAEAHGGLGKLSKLTKLNRQNLYKMLSKDGNPSLESLLPLLKAMGIRLTFSPSHKKAA